MKDTKNKAIERKKVSPEMKSYKRHFDKENKEFHTTLKNPEELEIHKHPKQGYKVGSKDYWEFVNSRNK